MFVFPLTNLSVSEEVRVDCEAKSSENLLHLYVHIYILHVFIAFQYLKGILAGIHA